MGLDISTFTTSPIEEPESLAAYEFAQALAGECSCIGEGMAFGWFTRIEVMWVLDAHTISKRLIREERVQIQDWINSLPWDEHDCIRLYFNW
ncbi:hypothetical protein M1O54_00220 [Dehalococcoidia bacterium]|nr:hypothetical protein [Dehalococcoidia bacterium]MCL0102826.1 hypothetical protein [Dehalococcoidia bacterium]